jgi:hypothetical protein
MAFEDQSNLRSSEQLNGDQSRAGNYGAMQLPVSDKG